MEMFPVITKNRQELYEKIFCDNKKLQNEVPCICGYYGRGCRKMNRPANGVPCIPTFLTTFGTSPRNENKFHCNNCSLRIFALACEAIKEQCDYKESLGIDYLYDSDILEIQEILENNHMACPYDTAAPQVAVRNHIHVNPSYIETLLESLANIEE